MIDRKYIEETAVKYQTTFINLLREYLQHRFLSVLYQKKLSGSLFFKGGTALRIVYQSPRYSEDLDFSISGISKSNIENLLEEVLSDLERENMRLDIIEAKKTTGGYIFIFKARIFDYDVNISLNLSARSETSGETVFINPAISTSYTVQILKLEKMLMEKLTASFTRMKARDFFDIYFILRSPNLRNSLKVTEKERTELKKLLAKIDKKEIAKDLKPLLPKTFHRLLHDMPNVLIKEIGL